MNTTEWLGMIIDVELDKDSADMDTPHPSSSSTRIGDTFSSEPVRRGIAYHLTI